MRRHVKCAQGNIIQDFGCAPSLPLPYLLGADSRLAPSQWETSLQCNAMSHWLGANLESAVLLTRVPSRERWRRRRRCRHPCSRSSCGAGCTSRWQERSLRGRMDKVTSGWKGCRGNTSGMRMNCTVMIHAKHADVMARKRFPCYWPFVRGIHRSPLVSPHWELVTQPLIFSLMSSKTNCGTNSRGVDDDLGRNDAHVSSL